MTATPEKDNDLSNQNVATDGAEIRPIWASTAEIMKMLGCGRSTLHTLQKRPDFPKPVRFSFHFIRWNINEITEWQAQQEKKANANYTN